MTRTLMDYLGVTRVIWLKSGLRQIVPDRQVVGVHCITQQLPGA